MLNCNENAREEITHIQREQLVGDDEDGQTPCELLQAPTGNVIHCTLSPRDISANSRDKIIRE